jgi:hypothetical protein
MQQLLSFPPMTDSDRFFSSDESDKHLLIAHAGWKIVYYANERYFVEDIIAYAWIKLGRYYELVPLTLSDIHMCQSLQDYTLKEGYLGLINPQNELIVNEYSPENQKPINLQKIKETLQKNRYKLD